MLHKVRIKHIWCHTRTVGIESTEEYMLTEGAWSKRSMGTIA